MTLESERGYQLSDGFVVYRFLDGVCNAKLGAFSSLVEAYRHAAQSQQYDRRPHVEFRIRGVGFPADVIARLNLPLPLPGPATTVWYLLESSRTKARGIPAQQVVRAIEAAGGIPDRSTPPKTILSTLTYQPPKPRKPRTPRRRYERDGEVSERRRRDPEIDDCRRDVTLYIRSEDELGLGIPAQANKGRRSRKGDYIP